MPRLHREALLGIWRATWIAEPRALSRGRVASPPTRGIRSLGRVAHEHPPLRHPWLRTVDGPRLLMTFDDLRPGIEARPAGVLARRVVPDFHRRIPAGAVPSEWLSAEVV